MARFPKYTDSRNIRVFISSTFKDMKGERDKLLKKVFPQLRKIASEHNVTLTAVDLRWGITEQEAKSKKVLELCFREIDNSIPFFIGIVGDRYGWCPSHNDVTEYCLESYKDIRKYLDMKLSVTEMEIQYGVLQRDEKLHASFYIKKSRSKRSHANSDKLENLKSVIRNQNRYPVNEYTSLDELADQVIANFIDLIGELFPKNLSNDSKQVISQEYVLSYLNQTYVSVQSYHDCINNWIANDDSHLFIIHGESGMGKSALLAGWIDATYNDEFSNHELYYYFTNNSKFQNSSDEILYYIYKSLCVEHDTEFEKSFKIGKNKVCELIEIQLKSRYESSFKFPIIIIDGIDQLYREELSNLIGALHVLSKYSKIIVSTKNLDVIPELEMSTNAEYLEVVPLAENDKRELITRYLSLYGKKMTDEQMNKIILDSQCNNTLILRSLLDELLTFGVQEYLTDRIDYYLAVDGHGFYYRLLDRYEDDFGKGRVRKLLCLIYFSKSGLTETDLKSIAKIRNLDFSEFITAFNHQLIYKDGRLTFSHTRISDSVYDRYVADNKSVESHFRRLIVRWFEKSDDKYAREEVAWQLYQQGEHAKLYKLLLKYEIVCFLPNTDFNLFVRYWIYLIQNGYSFADYLNDEECRHDDDLLQQLSDISLQYLNDEKSSSLLRKQIVDNFNARGNSVFELVKNIMAQSDAGDAGIYVDTPFNPNALCNRAELAFHDGHFAEASDLYREALDLVIERMEDYPDDLGLRMAEIDIRIKYGDAQDAMCEKDLAVSTYNCAYEKLKELQVLCPDMNLIADEVRILTNLGTTIYKDKPYASLDYLNAALELQKSRGLNNKNSVSLLMNIGVVYDEVLGLNLKGLEYYKMALEIQLSLTGERNLTTAALYKNISLASKDKKVKIESYNKAHEIYTAMGSLLELANLYESSAAEFFNTAFYHRAFKAYMQCLRLRSDKLGKEHFLTRTALENVMETLALISQLDVEKNDDPNIYDTEILIAASKAGFFNAEYELALRLFYGEYIDEDKAAALQLLESSACKGYVPAAKMLAHLYCNGIYVKQDYAKSIEYLYPIAESGDYEGQYEMGLRCEYGYGVEIDYDKAIDWYQKSADSGYANAYNPLAKLLCQRGDQVEALKWAKLAVYNFPEDWNSVNTLAFVYKSLSQMEHALKYFEICKELQMKTNVSESMIRQTELNIREVTL